MEGPRKCRVEEFAPGCQCTCLLLPPFPFSLFPHFLGPPLPHAVRVELSHCGAPLGPLFALLAASLRLPLVLEDGALAGARPRRGGLLRGAAAGRGTRAAAPAAGLAPAVHGPVRPQLRALRAGEPDARVTRPAVGTKFPRCISKPPVLFQRGQGSLRSTRGTVAAMDTHLRLMVASSWFKRHDGFLTYLYRCMYPSGCRRLPSSAQHHLATWPSQSVYG